VATDIAVDFGRRDLVVSPSRDWDIVTGQASCDQRIRIRLLMTQGEWQLDPTGGRLGSRLKDMFRLPIERALVEVPLVVREALADMADIQVVDVQCVTNEDNSRAIDITILYMMNEAGAEDIEADVLSTTVTVSG